MPFTGRAITLTDDLFDQLTLLVADPATEKRLRKRCQIILLAHQGLSSAAISKQIGMHESHIARWRRRFLEQGLEGLLDAPKSGRPRIYDDEQRTLIDTAVHQIKEELAVGALTYTVLARELRKRGFKISRSHLWNLLRQQD